MMTDTRNEEKSTLNKQQTHWEQTYTKQSELFGENPSEAAIKAVEIFKKAKVKTILELGGGQGRDAFYFAKNGFEVHVLDYTDAGIQAIEDKARALGLEQSVKAMRHDVRERFPFEDQTFDACYSHMLLCMALTNAELENIRDETLRVLRPGGVNIYTARNTNDPDYGTGIHRGEDRYESNGFIVHYFDEEKVTKLCAGFSKICMEEFEEGNLPRKLYFIAQGKHIS